MKRQWQWILALILLAMTAAGYTVHYLVFRDARHIFLYFLGDMAFVFFEVLLVTLVLHRLLHHRERRVLEDKLYMLTGAFFSELGTELLGRLSELDEEAHRLSARLETPEDWSEKEFLQVRRMAQAHTARIPRSNLRLEPLRARMLERKTFLLDLLQNAGLPKDEAFTHMVWAVYHLAKELENRRDLGRLSEADSGHLAEDMKRVYQMLLVQWMDYMKHLKAESPHLFSLAGRTNPFDPKAAVELR